MAVLSKPAGFVSRYKRYKASTKHSTTASDAKDIRIKTHELKKLAEIIISEDPPVEVPTGLMQVLEDVISGREACATWFNHSSAAQPALPVRTAPRPVVDQPIKKRKRKKKHRKSKGIDQDSPSAEVRNIFSNLVLEESSTEAIAGQTNDAPPPCRPDGAVGTYSHTAFELEESNGNDAFAVWCYLADLEEIRAHCRTVLNEYESGNTTIEIAGVVTETAFGMIERIHEEIVAAKPRFADWWCMALFLRLRLGLSGRLLYTFSKDPNAKAKSGSTQLKQTDDVCSAAELLLRVFREACQKCFRDSARTKTGFHEQHTDSKPFARSMIGSRPTSAFETTAFSFMPEISVRGTSNRMQEQGTFEGHRHYHTYLTDELTSLLPMHSDPIEPPLWLVVATQTCMYIQERVHPSNASNVLLSNAARTKQIVDDYFASNRGKFAHLREPERAANLEHLRQSVERAERAATAAVQDNDGSDFEERVFFPRLASLPHFAGEVTFSLKLRKYNIGTILMNDADAFLSIAHLYKAARWLGLVEGEWHDLDFVVAHHSSGKPFLTKTNANADPHALLRHYLLDLGVRASTLAKCKVPSLPLGQMRSGKSKAISAADSDFISAMLDHYRVNEEAKCDRAAVLDAVLSSMATKSGHNARSTASPRLTPVELLSQLQKELTAVEARINFDYVGFSRLYMKMLDEFVTQAEMKASAKELSKLRGGPESAYMLLKSAADVKAKSGNLDATAFAAGVAVFNSIVTADGKKYSQAAYDQSSGRIPKDRHPVLSKGNIPEAAIIELAKSLPGAAIGSSRDVVEVYDPTGSLQKLDLLFNKNAMAKTFAPDGRCRRLHLMIPEVDPNLDEMREGYSRPGLKFEDVVWEKTTDYISKAEGMEMEAKMRERAKIPNDS